jgi:hypothetical protein
LTTGGPRESGDFPTFATLNSQDVMGSVEVVAESLACSQLVVEIWKY